MCPTQPLPGCKASWVAWAVSSCSDGACIVREPLPYATAGTSKRRSPPAQLPAKLRKRNYYSLPSRPPARLPPCLPGLSTWLSSTMRARLATWRSRRRRGRLAAWPRWTTSAQSSTSSMPHTPSHREPMRCVSAGLGGWASGSVSGGGGCRCHCAAVRLAVCWVVALLQLPLGHRICGHYLASCSARHHRLALQSSCSSCSSRRSRAS